jgi:hypothetical protein
MVERSIWERVDAWLDALCDRDIERAERIVQASAGWSSPGLIGFLENSGSFVPHPRGRRWTLTDRRTAVAGDSLPARDLEWIEPARARDGAIGSVFAPIPMGGRWSDLTADIAILPSGPTAGGKLRLKLETMIV